MLFFRVLLNWSAQSWTDAGLITDHGSKCKVWQDWSMCLIHWAGSAKSQHLWPDVCVRVTQRATNLIYPNTSTACSVWNTIISSCSLLHSFAKQHSRRQIFIDWMCSSCMRFPHYPQCTYSLVYSVLEIIFFIKLKYWPPGIISNFNHIRHSLAFSYISCFIHIDWHWVGVTIICYRSLWCVQRHNITRQNRKDLD